MKRLLALACIQICQLGCLAAETAVPFDGGSCSPNDAATPPDLSQVKPTCTAAKGLAGVPLICADFTSPQILLDLKSLGWDFTSQCPAMWTVSSNNLQINSFSTFASTCNFTTRALNANEYQQYGSFTLSVVQTVDLNETKQKIQVMLGADDPPTRLIYQATGTTPRQRNIYEIAKTALPNGGNNNYQPLFKLTSTAAAGGTAQGLQIESIAVMGNP